MYPLLTILCIGLILSSMKKRILPEVDRVILPRLFNLRPGIWLFILALLVLIILCFVLFVLPGIRNGGKYVSFSLPVSETSVNLDSVYLGPADNNIYFIKAGRHELTFIKAGNVIKKIEIEIRNPIFFTYFFHYRQNVNIETIDINEQLINAVKQDYMKNLVSYSAIIDYDESYFYPPIISSYFKDAIYFDVKDMKELYYFTLLHITSIQMLDDLIEAEQLLDKNNINYSDDISRKLKAEITKAFGNEKYMIEKKMEFAVNKPSSYYIDNRLFFKYEGQEYNIGTSTTNIYPENNKASLLVDVKPFYFSSDMISEIEYSEFVESNPKWNLDNISNLIAEGLVDEYYLKGIDLNNPTRLPIRNISYKAALAYIDYLNGNNKEKYRLPSEEEFEIAATSTKDKAYANSLYTLSINSETPSGVMGGLYEFTSTYYLPFSRLTDYEKAQELSLKYDLDDVIIKGGSYINTNDEIKKEDVGVIRQDQTSPYVGIRLARDVE